MWTWPKASPVHDFSSVQIQFHFSVVDFSLLLSRNFQRNVLSSTTIGVSTKNVWKNHSTQSSSASSSSSDDRKQTFNVESQERTERFRVEDAKHQTKHLSLSSSFDNSLIFSLSLTHSLSLSVTHLVSIALSDPQDHPHLLRYTRMPIQPHTQFLIHER